MARTVGIGKQNYEKIVKNNNFYIDKTNFIKEWWENDDEVTLIARPRRFGKTLNISMVERFFSVDYANRSDLFENMNIWKEKKYQEMQGKYPVISLSFANVKENTFERAVLRICQIIADLYREKEFLKDSGFLAESERAYFTKVIDGMTEIDAIVSLQRLCSYMQRYYKQDVIILLDEYDTPMQEAYLNGYWNEIVSFIRNLFNCTFKTNPYL
ncbi:MAG TPA: hypothetical protein DDY31_02745, partial [Lachnospiraceae bacterium]|nr:hypothetical protein [Lachnospiraceae bacterium]